MKRDMELVRKILLRMEELDEPLPLYLEVDGYDRDLVGQHVYLLVEAGLIAGEVARRRGQPRTAHPFHITWEGYDFLDAARDPSVWERAKGRMQAVGGAVAIGIMIELLKDEARRRLGLK